MNASIWKALEMYYAAVRDDDSLRIAMALRHLEFLRDLQALTVH